MPRLPLPPPSPLPLPLPRQDTVVREGLRRLFEACGLGRNAEGGFEQPAAGAPPLERMLDTALREAAVDALRAPVAEPAAAIGAGGGAGGGGVAAAAAPPRRTFGPYIPPPAVLAAAAASAAAAAAGAGAGALSSSDDDGPLPEDHPGARRGMSNAELRCAAGEWGGVGGGACPAGGLPHWSGGAYV